MQDKDDPTLWLYVTYRQRLYVWTKTEKSRLPALLISTHKRKLSTLSYNVPTDILKLGTKIHWQKITRSGLSRDGRKVNHTEVIQAVLSKNFRERDFSTIEARLPRSLKRISVEYITPEGNWRSENSDHLIRNSVTLKHDRSSNRSNWSTSVRPPVHPALSTTTTADGTIRIKRERRSQRALD
jgi:hypothetical protein